MDNINFNYEMLCIEETAEFNLITTIIYLYLMLSSFILRNYQIIELFNPLT